MAKRLIFITFFCLIVGASVVQDGSLAEPKQGKYGHMIFDRVDRIAKDHLPNKGYEAFDESLQVIAKPRDTINKARDIIITDEDSQAAKIADTVLSKFFMLTILVGTGFGLIIKIAIWAMST